jgi:hypothetical protein
MINPRVTVIIDVTKLFDVTKFEVERFQQPSLYERGCSGSYVEDESGLTHHQARKNSVAVGQ